MSEIYSIALLSPRGFKFYTYEAVAGMVEYTGSHPYLRFKDLRFMNLDVLEKELPDRLRRVSFEALILGLNMNEYKKIAAFLPRGIPMCNIHPDLLAPEIPTISLDIVSLASKVVDYFSGMGFKHMGLLRAKGVNSKELVDYLKVSCEAYGMDCSKHAVETITSVYDAEVYQPDEELKEWLRDLPKPVAVLTSGGFSALMLSRAAVELGISVPDELAILSESDDESCLFADFPISSIRSAGPLIGHKALSLIDEALTSRAELPQGRITVPVPPIIERSSTGFPIGMDQDVRQAIRHIRTAATDGLTVSDVLAEFPMLSRAKFYRQFEKFIGRPPAEEILRVQIGKAKELLAYTAMNITEIADACGFLSQSAFSKTFNRIVGSAPSEWRRQGSLQSGGG